MTLHWFSCGVECSYLRREHWFVSGASNVNRFRCFSLRRKSAELYATHGKHREKALYILSTTPRVSIYFRIFSQRVAARLGDPLMKEFEMKMRPNKASFMVAHLRPREQVQAMKVCCCDCFRWILLVR